MKYVIRNMCNVKASEAIIAKQNKQAPKWIQ